MLAMRLVLDFGCGCVGCLLLLFRLRREIGLCSRVRLIAVCKRCRHSQFADPASICGLACTRAVCLRPCVNVGWDGNVATRRGEIFHGCQHEEYEKLHVMN